MALIDDVKRICDRLALHGWRELLLQHGLDITAVDLKAELAKELPRINRNISGFEDSCPDGIRAIEPSSPARSLLYHALASSTVHPTSNGLPSPGKSVYPTLKDLEVVENYIFGVKPLNLEKLLAGEGSDRVGLVVFAYEYRPAWETVHRKHADLCFSRTGVARVGTAAAAYDPARRGFVPRLPDDDPHKIRVLPARYAAYVAVLRKGDRRTFGPLRFQKPKPGGSATDDDRFFWVPVHKLFDGSECIADVPDLRVELTAHHLNEKIFRVHKSLQQTARLTRQQLNSKPYRFTDRIAEFSRNPGFGSGLLVPDEGHPQLVERAVDVQGNPVTFRVPKNGDTLHASVLIESEKGEFRHAPEYVHARTLVNGNGKETDLNAKFDDVDARVKQGGYRARHYMDFTGDGWIEVSCPALSPMLVPLRVAAYSLVTAPDFFPGADQGELLEWSQGLAPAHKNIWVLDPVTLADSILPANINLVGSGFQATGPGADTITAIVSMEFDPNSLGVEKSQASDRYSHLPDAAAGEFQPGWDVSRDRTDGVEHLAAYGLGSPFPEDSKLCAALSTFWPAVAPDAARTYSFPFTVKWPTVSPLTDEEIGQTGTLPWDGITGPRVSSPTPKIVEYPSFDHADYVRNALSGKFSLALTARVDTAEYKRRVMVMWRCYRALGVDLNAVPKTARLEKSKWALLSFRTVPIGDQELQTARQQASNPLFRGPVYRLRVYRRGKRTEDLGNRKILERIAKDVLIFMDEAGYVINHGTSPKWRYVRDE